jgi:cytochrome P450
MDYLTAFLKETLRMATPATTIMHRVALSDHKLGNLEIKKGTTLATAFMGNNFSEEYFDEPLKFKPERFYDKNSITNENLAKNPYAFIPFSAGGRNCIGQHLAMNEAKIILGLFLRTFNFDLQDPNYKLKMNQTFMHEPRDPLIYVLEQQNH